MTKLKVAVSIIKYTFISFLLLVIVLLTTIILSLAFSNKKYLDLFGYSVFEVQSYSMYPELTKGDLILVKKRDSSEYDVGMTVTYLRPTDKSTTTHKIVNIDGNIVTTKGINAETNNDCDVPFEIEYIIGEVVHVWTGYSEVKQFITHPIGIIIIILSNFLLIEGFSYLEIKLSNKEENSSGKEQQ